MAHFLVQFSLNLIQVLLGHRFKSRTKDPMGNSDVRFQNSFVLVEKVTNVTSDASVCVGVDVLDVSSAVEVLGKFFAAEHALESAGLKLGQIKTCN